MGEIIRYKMYHWIDRYIGIPACFLFLPIARIFKKRSLTYRNILIIKLGMMGDAILLIPSVRALREKFRNTFIAVFCSKANKDIFQNCPYLDEVIAVDFINLINPMYLFRIIKRLKKSEFDLVVDFEQWSRLSAIISFFSSSKQRIGFKTQSQYRHYLFTNTTPHIRNKHEVECFFDLLKILDIETKNKDLELWPNESDRKQADIFLQSQKINSHFIILHTEVPISGRQRQWPIKNFAELGNRLIKKYNFKIIIVSTYKGKSEADKLNFLLGKSGYILIDVSLLTLYVIISKAKLVITNNTGFMHLAASATTPVVALHGPTSPIKWGPWGKNNLPIKSNLVCSPCLYLGFEYGCNTNQCMQDISPEQVLEEIGQFLIKK